MCRKKITGDYLVGQWECTFNDYQVTTIKDGKIIASEKYISNGKSKIGIKVTREFSKEGNVIFESWLTLNDISNEGVVNYEQVYLGMHIYGTMKFMRISDNKFNSIGSFSVVATQLGEGVVRKVTSEDSCVKVTLNK